MYKIQLVYKNDYDGIWWVVRITAPDGKRINNFFSKEDDARASYAKLLANSKGEQEEEKILEEFETAIHP